LQLAGRLGILFVGAAALMVLALPGARETFDYLIAGTFASALTLVVAFGLFVTGRL
jgi:hypothetical protein